MDKGFEKRRAQRKNMKVVLRSLDDPEDNADVLAMTPGERVALVETLRQNGYAFLPPQPRLPRHAWPVAKASR